MMGDGNTLLLSQNNIEELIDLKDVVRIVEETFKGLGEDTVVNPAKVTLDLGETAPWPPYNGFMNAMPAYVGWLDTAGMKWVGGFLDNCKRNLPYISGMILLIDPQNGQFTCVADGALITSWRTGAQTAVALKYLHVERSIRIGLYGAGAQGRTQTMAVSEVFSIEELKVYDIQKDASEKFAREMGDFVDGRILIVDSPEKASDADVVISVTHCQEAFIKNAWIRPGTVLFPMGSYQECEDEFILGADKIIVDHVEQCLHRGALKRLSEKGLIRKDDIYGTIGELVAGKKKDLVLETERILCIPVGTGAMDVAVATVAYQRAVEKGLGTEFSFS